jgi:hypothetical protein
MAKKTPISKLTKKRRGPAPTGWGKAQLVRMHDPMLREIDAWRDRQADKPGRAEAIRRLVEMGLQVNRRK